MPTLRIPLVGSYTNRNATSTGKDQVFTNCYPEVTKNPVTGKGSVELYKRLGYTKGVALSSVASAGTSGGIVSWTGSVAATPPVVAAFLNTGGASMSVWDLVSDTKKGGDIPATTECTAITETMVSATPTLVANFWDNVASQLEQWYLPEGGAWAQVTSATLSSAIVGFPVHLDGYVFNMTSDGKILNSDLNTVSTQTATNFISASEFPDKGVTVARLGPHVIAFGEKSIERFYNAGNATGSPLSRVQDGGIHMGAARRPLSALQTVLIAHGTIWFIGTNSEGAAIGIYRFNGVSPEKVSNPGIDKLVMLGGFDGFVGSMVAHGMRHVVIKGSTAGVWCYCLETNTWWNHALASGEITACIGANVFQNPAHGRTYFVGTNNARSNLMTGDQDDGVSFAWTLQMQNDDLGTRRKKYYRAVSLIGDIQTSTCNIGVSFSDDDYATFSSSRNIDMSTTNNRLTRWGASRRRAWKLSSTSATPSRLEAFEVEYELGS